MEGEGGTSPKERPRAYPGHAASLSPRHPQSSGGRKLPSPRLYPHLIPLIPPHPEGPLSAPLPLWGQRGGRAACGGAGAGPAPQSPRPPISQQPPRELRSALFTVDRGVLPSPRGPPCRCRRAPPGPPPPPCPRCPAQRWRPARAQPQRARCQDGGRKRLHPPHRNGGGGQEVERGEFFCGVFASPRFKKSVKKRVKLFPVK